MGKLFKLIGMLCAISLLVLPQTGCENPPWESGMTLVLKVDAPKEGTTINESAVMVSGRVSGSESAGAKVTINGADAPVKDGKYSANVTLTEGINVIQVVAKSNQANLTEKVSVTYLPAKK